MKINVRTEFSPNAEQLLHGKTGIVQFEFPPGVYPNAGDTVVLRSAPENQSLAFVCTGRRFQFARKGELDLTIYLDFE